ncbi:MAG TPA: adenylyl-sulfate kinase [Mycobacteriales bacterium]|jgi:adenylylsulfate kinase|nr:adenylyl-sulfate kinase [Mycobacteriales bacterium]
MRGLTIWLTGLPSAGKTTIANAVAERLDGPFQVLDGDEIREYLSRGLGFTKEDRDTQVLRVGWVAKTLARHGVTVLASLVSPYADARDKVRALHGEAGVGFYEVHVATPLEVTRERDVKGLYAKAYAGEIANFTGVQDPYEPPSSPDLVIRTQDETVEESAARVLALLDGAR